MVKLMVGLLAVTAIAVSSGFAAAHNQNQPANLTGYNKEQCMDGGWEALGFKNQGDCISYFVTGGNNPPAADGNEPAAINTTEETNVQATVSATDGASIGAMLVAVINAPSEINVNVPAAIN